MPAASRQGRLRLVGGTSSARSESERFGARAELDDGQLAALARDGDSLAFEALYRRHATFAINLAVRIQGNATDVEDVVHDAFLRAHQRLAELRDPAAFRSWLGSIVVRFVRTRLRRARLLGSLRIGSADPVDLDAIASDEASPDQRAELAQIYALLRTMPTDERIAWTLRYVERHRLEVVAELAGCSLATAKRRIQRGQRFLAEHFVSPFAEDRK
ncbi:MAG: sigma-70 family RNA polymerase sigma factor [Sorangiineae bacterium]|nr:sigma-70 family RNA polymerase sigma factor [Polyangiaceae bacterium]MEB2324677.1 sigma-70 family RNA polymerase sigma factor [Sorangiineae bacterium]